MTTLSNQNLESILLNAGASFVGFAEINNNNPFLSENLKTVISIGIACEPSALNLEVEALHTYIADTKIKMATVLETCVQHLQKESYETLVPQVSESLANLSTIFSHKMAATMSGLGWIGKSSLFISNKFGCGSRLAIVFTNAPFVYGKAITKSLCGSCDKCIKACPCKAIKGNNWNVETSREELLDPWICKRYRDSFKTKLGFSHPCWLCIKKCPKAVKI